MSFENTNTYNSENTNKKEVILDAVYDEVQPNKEDLKYPVAVNESGDEGKRKTTPENNVPTGEKSEDGFLKKAKNLFSNPEIKKQFAKSMIGSLASIAGIKAIYDVPKYLSERWQVRGMFGKGKGLSGSMEELLEASWANHKRIATKGGESTKVREAINDLNKRLNLTKEGSEKGSEQRKKMAELLRENRRIKMESGQSATELDVKNIENKSGNGESDYQAISEGFGGREEMESKELEYVDNDVKLIGYDNFNEEKIDANLPMVRSGERSVEVAQELSSLWNNLSEQQKALPIFARLAESGGDGVALLESLIENVDDEIKKGNNEVASDILEQSMNAITELRDRAKNETIGVEKIKKISKVIYMPNRKLLEVLKMLMLLKKRKNTILPLQKKLNGQKIVGMRLH